MIVMVSRTFFSKVRSDGDIVFKKRNEDGEGTRSFFAEVKASLREKYSMFAWANKGEWESVEDSDAQVKRERNWFRIGFEPLFVDYTKEGAWFIVYMLLEVSCLFVRSG